jgi:hypothetical protein
VGAACRVCTHDNIDSINTELMAGVSQSKLCAKYAFSQAALRNHSKFHITIPGKGETNSFRELRTLKDRVEKALDRIDAGSADDIERKQHASLLREHRTITEKLGSLSGEINSKTVSALLHRLGVKSERELLEIVEERRKMSDITVDDLVADCVKGLKDAFTMNPAFREVVQEALFPKPDEPEMED